MFRDESVALESMISTWQPPRNDAAPARAPLFDAFANDEIGAVWQVYREIAARIPRNSYTRHASTLADALR